MLNIALLAPTLNSVEHQLTESALQNLSHHLSQKINLKVFNLSGSGETGDNTTALLSMAKLFEQANEFDLIHNLAGAKPMVFSPFTYTPVLTTLFQPIDSQDLSVLKTYQSTGFYVGVKRGFSHPELHCFGSFDHDFTSEKIADTAKTYLDLYEKIVKQTQREDHRPWGFYEILSDSPTHKVKRITVFPDKRLSYQRHFKRAEHWYIVHGKATVTRDGEEIRLSAGQAIDLPLKAWHRIQNSGDENMVFIEVQTGDYFGEDDIERAQDDFGRV